MKLKVKYLGFTAGLIFIGVIVGVILTAKFDVFKTSQAQDINISKESIDIISKIDRAMDELTAANQTCSGKYFITKDCFYATDSRSFSEMT